MNSGLDIQPKLFDITGVVVVGYALFAFMLGAALGAIIRRPGWAFAAGVPLFALVRLLVGAVRSTLVSPVSLVEPFQGSEPNGWVLHYGYVPIGRTTPSLGVAVPIRGSLLVASVGRDSNLRGCRERLLGHDPRGRSPSVRLRRLATS